MSEPSRYARGFGALRYGNFRWYFASQVVSVSGTWMQTTALGWLVVQLTGDGVALGTTLALQYGPLLILGPWGGSLVDRYNVRRLVLFAQASAGVLALVLFALASAGLATMPVIYLISFLMGLNGVIDNPARRALVSELVPSSELASAVSLIGVLVNGSRVVGPAIAAVLIAFVGTTPCFLVNGVSYFAVVGALLLLNQSELIPRPVRAPGPIRVMDTLRYVAGVPVLRRALGSMAIVGTFTLEMSVTLPLISSNTFGGDGSTYGILLALMSIGGIAGSLAAGVWGDPQLDRLEVVLVACFVAVAAAGIAPTLPFEALALVFTGLTTFYYVAIASTGAQLNATPEHRGRVLALWSMAFLGTTMIGAPIIGWIANVWGPRAGLLAGAVACLAAAAFVYLDRIRGERASTAMVSRRDFGTQERNITS